MLDRIVLMVAVCMVVTGIVQMAIHHRIHQIRVEGLVGCLVDIDLMLDWDRLWQFSVMGIAIVVAVLLLLMAMGTELGLCGVV